MGEGETVATLGETGGGSVALGVGGGIVSPVTGAVGDTPAAVSAGVSLDTCASGVPGADVVATGAETVVAFAAVSVAMIFPEMSVRVNARASSLVGIAVAVPRRCVGMGRLHEGNQRLAAKKHKIRSIHRFLMSFSLLKATPLQAAPFIRTA